MEVSCECWKGDDDNEVKSSISSSLFHDVKMKDNIETSSRLARVSSGKQHLRLSISSRKTKTWPRTHVKNGGKRKSYRSKTIVCSSSSCASGCRLAAGRKRKDLIHPSSFYYFSRKERHPSCICHVHSTKCSIGDSNNSVLS